MATPSWRGKMFKDPFTIGRSRKCDLIIPTCEDTRTISKIHARVFPITEQTCTKWMLQDLDTLNGTAVNGMDIIPGSTIELHTGDEIQLSSITRTGLRILVELVDEHHSKLCVIMSSDDTKEEIKMENTRHERKRPRPIETNEDQDRFMTCPVCLEYFHQSATLNCSHSFCEPCISHWFRTSPLLNCPQCRSLVKTVPVRNRALDDLIHHLVGHTDAYQAITVKKSSRRSSASITGFDFTSYNILTRWEPEACMMVASVISKQYGELREKSCRAMGLHDEIIDTASSNELVLVAQNLLIDCSNLRLCRDVCERLKIFIRYG